MCRGVITEESFCGFFLSQKTLFHLVEVVCRMQDNVNLYLKELKVYKTYSSTERFKVRIHLNEIVKQLDDMSHRIESFLLHHTREDVTDSLDDGT